MSDNEFSITLNNEKEQHLKHIKVYNKLYELIKNGVFPIGYQLPTEPELAVKMEVSRVTLRRALALLREDGLVSNIRGKGNFVTSPDGNIQTIHYTKKIQHPFYACSILSTDELEVNFKIAPPTEAILKSLAQDTAVVIVCERWYKNGSDYIGFSLTYLPIEIITEFKINLNDQKDIERFIEEEAYTQTIKSSTSITFSTDGNTVSGRYDISDKDSFILLKENLFTKDNKIMMYSHYFIPTDNFNLTINLNDKFEF